MSMYLIAYVPVLHEGYRRMFSKYPSATLCVIGSEQVKVEFPLLGRDRRQLPTEDVRRAVLGLQLFTEVRILDDALLAEINAEEATVVMPKDDISTVVAERLPACNITYETVFLRWDKTVTLQELEVRPDSTVSSEEADRMCMEHAQREADKSGDWWRQVGAVAVKDGRVLFTGYNKHHPSEHVVYMDGNPRDNFDAGEHPEVSPTLHGEASIVAQAARAGVSLLGASVYVTTFPCSNCAHLLGEVGIGRVYYRDGYSRLDAEVVLRERGVEIIRVV
jgi:dCMP deaminase